MIWSHSNAWMLTADHGGFVKYWQSNMNNVKMYQAHKDPVRGLRWESSGLTLRHFTFHYVATWRYSCQVLVTTTTTGPVVVACDNNKVDTDAVTTSGRTHNVTCHFSVRVMSAMTVCRASLLQICLLYEWITITCNLCLMLLCCFVNLLWRFSERFF